MYEEINKICHKTCLSCDFLLEYIFSTAPDQIAKQVESKIKMKNYYSKHGVIMNKKHVCTVVIL